VDVYPLISPWPVRIEFFGEEVESLRFFDPLTRFPGNSLSPVTIPPAGELVFSRKPGSRDKRDGRQVAQAAPFATLARVPPGRHDLLGLRPGAGAEAPELNMPSRYTRNPFFVAWEDFQQQAVERGMTLLELSEGERFRPLRRRSGHPVGRIARNGFA